MCPLATKATQESTIYTCMYSNRIQKGRKNKRKKEAVIGRTCYK
jgi:hypothetical protein